jgi:hypothetical protein
MLAATVALLHFCILMLPGSNSTRKWARHVLFVCLQVVGPKADAARIPGIDVQLADGDTWKFGESFVHATTPEGC